MLNNLRQPKWQQTHVGGSRFLSSDDVSNEQKRKKYPPQSTVQSEKEIALSDWKWSTQISKVKNPLPCPPMKD